VNKIILAAAIVFFSDKSHASKNVVFITRDGQSFYEWHDANEHTKSLGNSDDDRKIEEVQRKDVPIEEVKKSIPEQIEECTTVEAVEALVKPNWSKVNKDLAAAKIETLKGE
jgi:hypothetical protein